MDSFAGTGEFETDFDSRPFIDTEILPIDTYFSGKRLQKLLMLELVSLLFGFGMSLLVGF